MKIKDIQKYLEGYNPDSSLSELGTDDEPFLETLYGVDQKIDATIRDVASFASNSEEQLFYEFVQNAFDADADSLCFFVDKDWLIVLNNGEPFYTDKRQKGKKMRDGQLYNFLAKGKSLKAGDDTKSGEFGQGSKLLYTLISDKSLASNKQQLLKAIKEECKGPYIISWGNPEQLSDFRMRNDGWQMTDPYAEKGDLLVVKILMTYYPVTPGIDENLFSNKEYFAVRDAFERLVDPKSNINKLSKGTVIVIPLGRGQYEAISAENNLKKVSQRLGGFASLTSNKVKNHGKHLDQIFVCGKEVELQHAESVFVNFEMDDENFEYQFAFNPTFAKEGGVNLFKTLPILQAHYGLGFLVDSQNFELDSSRQRINDESKTKAQLYEALKHLVDTLTEIKRTDKQKFDYIYSSIVSSTILKKNTDMLFVSDPFYDVFTPFIKANVKTDDCDYLPIEQVFEEVDDEPRIPLAKVGITDKKWINTELSGGKLRQRFDLKNELGELSIEEILSEADPEKLENYIKSISKEEYLELHPLLADYCCDEDLENLKVFRSNKGNVYSYKEITSSSCNVFLYRDDEKPDFLDRCPELEYILGPVDYNENKVKNNEVLNLNKIVSHIDYFREKDSRIDAACHIIAKCYDMDRYDNIYTAIRNHIPLLMNLNGEYKCFSELIKEAPAGTAILSGFCVAGYVPESLPEGFMVSKEGEIWEWIMDNFECIKDIPDWEEHHSKYISDLMLIYANAGEDYEDDTLELYLDANGKPVDEKVFYVDADKNLSEEEYELFSDFAETKGYTLVPRKFRKALTEAPFKVDSASVSDILDQKSIVDSRMLDIIIRIYTHILDNHRIHHYNSLYEIERAGGNFICSEKDSTADTLLSGIGLIRIQPEVAERFRSDIIKDFDLTKNADRIKNAISSIDSEKVISLLPYVKISNEDVQIAFYNKLMSIDINNKIDESDIRWKAIRFALSKISGGNTWYRDRLLNLITYNEGHLPDSIKSNKVVYGETVYDLYKLLGQVKVDNELVDSLISCLPDGETFRSVMYTGHEETAEPKDVYDELYDKALSIEQMRFCLDYCLHEEDCENDKFSLDSSVPKANALSMVSRYYFKDFDLHMILPGFNKDIQVLGDKTLLLQNEQMPEYICHWLNSDSVASTLISGLHRDNEDYIAIRKAILNNEPFSGVALACTDPFRLARTMQWAIEKKFTIEDTSYRYWVIRDMVSRQQKGANPLAMLRYTGVVKEQSQDVFVQMLVLEYVGQDGCVAEYSNVLLDSTTSLLRKNAELKKFFQEHKVFGYDTRDYLDAHGLSQRTRFVLKTAAEEKDYSELNDDIYKKWKNMKESEGICLFTCSDPIGTIFSITSEPKHEVVFSVNRKDSLFGYNYDLKQVIIQHPNSEQLTVMKALEKASKEILFFTNPFITLQGLYIEMMQDLTAEELALVAANRDKINNLLIDMSTDDDDTPESKVRKMIGYIGEQIYKLYLEKNGREYEYSAAMGIGEYDFKLPGSKSTFDTYVDVKTNLYTFVDAAVPFYIHKSQNKFMQQHPEASYRIVRISLTDINLKKEYEHIRNYFGPEADVEGNSELRERCDKIAANYWKAAKIQEFDAASPEYGIKIEKKIK